MSDNCSDTFQQLLEIICDESEKYIEEDFMYSFKLVAFAVIQRKKIREREAKIAELKKEIEDITEETLNYRSIVKKSDQ